MSIGQLCEVSRSGREGRPGVNAAKQCQIQSQSATNVKTTEKTDDVDSLSLAVGSGVVGCTLVSEKIAAIEVGTHSILAFVLFFFLTRALNPNM